VSLAHRSSHGTRSLTAMISGLTLQSASRTEQPHLCAVALMFTPSRKNATNLHHQVSSEQCPVSAPRQTKYPTRHYPKRSTIHSKWNIDNLHFVQYAIVEGRNSTVHSILLLSTGLNNSLYLRLIQTSILFIHTSSRQRVSRPLFPTSTWLAYAETSF